MFLPCQVRMYAADSRRFSEAARAQGDCNIELILYTKLLPGKGGSGEAVGKRLGSNGGYRQGWYAGMNQVSGHEYLQPVSPDMIYNDLNTKNNLF